MQEKNEGGQNKQGGSASPNQGGLSWSTPQNQSQANKPAAPAKPSAPAPQSGNSSAKYAGMVVIGVVAGIILAWGWVAWRSAPSDTAENTAGTSTTNTGATSTGTNTDTGTVGTGSDPALTVVSPQAAGNSVAIAKAVVSSPTWVVIYENNNGGPGNALGAALFFPEKQSGTVELLRATTPGKTYLAVKQVDDGDRKFSLRGDQFLSEGGEVQWVTFEAK